MSHKFFLEKTEQKLHHLATMLVEQWGCVAFKMETESEGASIPEIASYKQWVGDVAPVLVKIGGPNARNDVREFANLGVRHFAAPLVESAYAVQEFAKAVRELASDECFTTITIETITAMKYLSDILVAAKREGIQQITLGRSDLSASMNKFPEDKEVLDLCISARNQAKKEGILVALGGATTPSSQTALAQVQPDKFETRNVVFSMSSCPDPVQAIEQGIRFEIKLLEVLAAHEFRPRATVEKRIRILEERVGTRQPSQAKLS